MSLRDDLDSAQNVEPLKALARSVIDGQISFTELRECLLEPDVQAKASTVLERACRLKPGLAQGASEEIALLAEPSLTWLHRMNACRLIPLVTWDEVRYEWILEFLFSEVERNEGFVAAWALDALAHLAVRDESIRGRVRYLLEEAELTGSPSVRARARNASKRL